MFALACNCISTTPGASDGGPVRPRCADCASLQSYACDLAECVPNCPTSGAFACVSEKQRCLVSRCIDKRIPSCTDVPCNADQRCVAEACVPLGNVACTTLDDPTCGEDALCDLDSHTCAALPHCDADYACRPGPRGATCNNTSDYEHDRHPRVSGPRCLRGYCAIDADCPAPLHCTGVGATYTTLGTCG